MNVGEYGNVLRFNVGEDISSNNNILELKSPSPVAKTISITGTEGLSVGTSPISTPEGDFNANEYVEYTIKSGDIFIHGVWEARVFSQSSDETVCKITDKVSSFTVDP